MEQKIIPTIIYNNEKIITYKIINKNKHILISENGTEILRKEFFNNPFIVICDECGKQTILQNLPNINKKFYCRHCSRLGEKNPMYHKTVSVETRKKQSEKLKIE